MDYKTSALNSELLAVQGSKEDLLPYLVFTLSSRDLPITQTA